MDKKALEKYLQPSYGLLIIAGIMGVFALMLLMGGLILPCLIPLIPCVICGWVGWSSIKKFREQLNALEEAGRLSGVTREFTTGRQFFGDKLRMGPTYILGKNAGTVLTYSMVTKVYQHVHRTNYVEDRRELRVETGDGKTVILCKLPLKGKADQEVAYVMALMKTVNPGVHLGYK